MSEYLSKLIGYQVQRTAEWRRGRAARFSNDDRNTRAAERLELLEREIDALEGSDIEKQIEETHESINALSDGVASVDVWFEVTGAVSAELRAIGFNSSYTLVEFLEWYRDFLNEKLHELTEKVVPPPDLEEAVANDPLVKAAKQVYDRAYAKALAGAHKRLP